MKAIVPAGNGQVEHVVNKLEKVSHPMSLVERLLSFLLKQKVVVLSLLNHNA